MKPNLSKFTSNVKTFVVKRSPELLIGVGIAGMAASTVLAVKATPKAIELIEEERDRRELDISEKLKPVDVIKVTWKCYVPAVSSFIFASICLIGSNSVNTRRNSALAAAYKLSEKALLEYRDAVVETIGEEKEKDIREKVAEKRLKENPVVKSEVIVTERGQSLCYEAISSRYFTSSVNAIDKAVNSANKQMLRDNYISLNEFYDELDLDHARIGNDLGWNLDDGLIEVHYSSHIADDDTPCIVIDYINPPKYDFDRFG